LVISLVTVASGPVSVAATKPQFAAANRNQTRMRLKVG
jgi:hypothetical protein